MILAKRKRRLQEPIGLGTLETFETLILRKRKRDCKSFVRLGALEILGDMTLAYHKKRSRLLPGYDTAVLNATAREKSRFFRVLDHNRALDIIDKSEPQFKYGNPP
jgi:hypothetical protein